MPSINRLLPRDKPSSFPLEITVPPAATTRTLRITPSKDRQSAVSPPRLTTWPSAAPTSTTAPSTRAPALSTRSSALFGTPPRATALQPHLYRAEFPNSLGMTASTASISSITSQISPIPRPPQSAAAAAEPAIAPQTPPAATRSPAPRAIPNPLGRPAQAYLMTTSAISPISLSSPLTALTSASIPSAQPM